MDFCLTSQMRLNVTLTCHTTSHWLVDWLTSVSSEKMDVKETKTYVPLFYWSGLPLPSYGSHTPSSCSKCLPAHQICSWKIVRMLYFHLSSVMFPRRQRTIVGQENVSTNFWYHKCQNVWNNVFQLGVMTTMIHLRQDFHPGDRLLRNIVAACSVMCNGSINV